MAAQITSVQYGNREMGSIAQLRASEPPPSSTGKQNSHVIARRAHEETQVSLFPSGLWCLAAVDLELVVPFALGNPSTFCVRERLSEKISPVAHVCVRGKPCSYPWVSGTRQRLDLQSSFCGPHIIWFLWSPHSEGTQNGPSVCTDNTGNGALPVHSEPSYHLADRMFPSRGHQ